MISLNLTIFNKEFLLRQVLDAIKQHTLGNYELVCVLDGCVDKSELILDTFIKENPQIATKKLYADNVFETKANNLAAKNSSGDYIIIIQDDMIMDEMGWNQRLLKPFNSFHDVFAVTARTAHNWQLNPRSNDIHDSNDRDDSWSDILFHTDHAHKMNLGRETFGVRDCVNRGPLAIRKDILDSVGGFDEIFSPQDMDDHDFCYRVFKKTGMVCGCYPIEFISCDEWGGTRENGIPKSWLLKANQKNVKIVWNRHQDLILNKVKIIENRKLS